MLHHGPADFVLWTSCGGTKVTEKRRRVMQLKYLKVIYANEMTIENSAGS
jgi:hypothetical protein